MPVCCVLQLTAQLYNKYSKSEQTIAKTNRVIPPTITHSKRWAKRISEFGGSRKNNREWWTVGQIFGQVALQREHRGEKAHDESSARVTRGIISVIYRFTCTLSLSLSRYSGHSLFSAVVAIHYFAFAFTRPATLLTLLPVGFDKTRFSFFDTLMFSSPSSADWWNKFRQLTWKLMEMLIQVSRGSKKFFFSRDNLISSFGRSTAI